MIMIEHEKIYISTEKRNHKQIQQIYKTVVHMKRLSAIGFYQFEICAIKAAEKQRNYMIFFIITSKIFLHIVM